jgi:hypothetical protein
VILLGEMRDAGEAERIGVRQEVPDDLLLSERVIDKGLPRKGWAFCHAWWSTSGLVP